jgi:hypothetical protein
MGPDLDFRVALGISQKKDLHDLMLPQLPGGTDGVIRDRIIKKGRIYAEDQIARIPAQLNKNVVGRGQWQTVPMTFNG